MKALFFHFIQFLHKLKSNLPDKDNLDWLDGIACFVGVWFLFFPYPSFKGLFCVLSFIPILGTALTILKGNVSLNRFFKKKANEIGIEENIPLTYIQFSSIALALGIFRRFNCESYYWLIITTGILFLFFAIAIFLLTYGIKVYKKNSIGNYVILTLSALIYSYGVLFGINCLFDSSPPQRFRTSIIYKHEGGGGDYAPTYDFTIAPWGDHKDPENIPASEKQYDTYNIDRTVYVYQKNGLLGIPWYYIEHIETSFY